jgi:hypothetical protein
MKGFEISTFVTTNIVQIEKISTCANGINSEIVNSKI